MKTIRVVLFAVAALAVGSAGAAQDAKTKTIDNPEYKSWQKFPKGTAFVVRMTSDAAGNKSETVMTTTLTEVGADKVAVETAVTTKVAGMEFKAPPTKRDVPKTVDVPVTTPKADPNAKPPGTIETGTDTVTVGDTKYKAKFYTYKTETMGIRSEGKVWMTDELPVGVVLKMTGKAAGSETAAELIEVKKPTK